jgi:hypothetical protein
MISCSATYERYIPSSPLSLLIPSPLNLIMLDMQDDHRFTIPVNSMDISEAIPKKFHLASDLDKTVSTSQIGEKVIDTTIQLSVYEILTVSSEISRYLHDQTSETSNPYRLYSYIHGS